MVNTAELCEELLRLGFQMEKMKQSYAQIYIIWHCQSGAKNNPVAYVNTSRLNDYSTDYPFFKNCLDIEQKMALTLLLEDYAKTPLRYR